MCDVPSIAVFCSESIECFPGTASKFFFRLLVTIPVAPIIIIIIIIIYCNWVVTRWQWLFYMYTKHEIGYWLLVYVGLHVRIQVRVEKTDDF